jgi:uncharacterized membrane protein (UPF0127 family)
MKFLHLAALLVALPLAACAQDRTCMAGRTEVLLRAAPDADPLRVRVEIAKTDEQRQKGLMFRRQMDENFGMLFTWPVSGDYKMWMKNTYIPLDMIYAQRGVVVGVVENAQPLIEETLGVDKPADTVLEVNAGFAKRHGVGPGWQLRVCDE